ncbi:hypothetical protein LOTGIDRAFT_166508 [Lottia gigantea]|uniref:Beta-glucuronidase n=1 Tax=Lottia gigantea TaxID=225164 RepID=V4A2U2_LOTGI|nr:hypothetical protein LOTGIDRAFT_166508 [Lottia gigantea]ESO87621.1 hypothetical protein LOTGIDRAFT_166508 [Lottia gigantea]
MLYPRSSESRKMQYLDGMWDFRADDSPSRDAGFKESWQNQPLFKTGPVIPMAVPSSYNDITADKNIRDFVGWAWYDTEFFISKDWANRRIVLRFDSAHYYSIVYVNGQQAMTHVGGHLPFETEINNFINVNQPNLLTLALNNTLSPTTLPPGTISYKNDTSKYPEGYFVQNLQMDFFNYAGIHRHVRIYSTPKTYIDDITVTPDINFNRNLGILNYEILTVGGTPGKLLVELLDREGSVVVSETGNKGFLSVSSPHLWWPYTMNLQDPGYLYTMKVTLQGNDSDVYRLPVGIRTVNVTTDQFLINHKPFYCHGVDKHEDADIRGKGLDYALIARDFSMLKWLGVNCFRTSHYPYAEEILDQADQQGIVIIDESPGVGIKSNNLGNESLNHHLEVMLEMYQRDKNRPGVCMWSVANEPESDIDEAVPYFKSVIDYTRKLDPTRPVSFTCSHDYNSDKVVPFVDVIMINRYYGWYSDTGHPEVIQLHVNSDFKEWRKLYNKPLLVSEFGAGTVSGLHAEPSSAYTEDYQVDVLSQYHQAFDESIGKFLVGELIWNFADFMTAQGSNRVNGNKKGILTRQRQPKPAAHLVRARYHSMFNATFMSEKSYCPLKFGCH